MDKFVRTVSVITLIAFLAAATHSVPLSQLEPADEYFGHEKLSVLVIRHKIFAIKDDVYHARVNPLAAERDADSVRNSFLDWTRKYPNDTWLPFTAWNLATLYEVLPGRDAQQRAIAQLRFVQDHYASSRFAGDAQRALARGIAIRPWPRVAAQSSAPADAPSLLQAVRAARALRDARVSQNTITSLENSYWRLSRGGNDPAYTACAWELAQGFESLPGTQAKDHAVRLLALLLDRYSTSYGSLALHELERR